MLTNDQVVDLLTLAAGYDRRKVGLADVAVWHDAAERNRWQPDDAMTAVKVHYATSTAWLMPGHIAEIIRAERRQPAPFVPEPPPPAIEAAARTALPSIADATADTPPIQTRPGRPNPLSRWSTRKSRRDPLEGDLRKRIQAELDAKRPAPEPES